MTGQPERAVGDAVAAMGGLDVLVNNAGNVSAGNLDEIAIDDIVAMVQLNLVAPILLTRAALPALRESGRRGGALVVGVSSGIALVGMPYYATYAATKAGLSRFDEALRRELIGTGVSVATVYPGATETPMMATSHAGPDLGFQRRPVSDVVDDIVMALEAGKVEIDTSQGADRHARQELNKRDPEAVDAELAPKLAALHEATRTHRSM
jgi:short-subunit dehydrogenase